MPLHRYHIYMASHLCEFFYVKTGKKSFSAVGFLLLLFQLPLIEKDLSHTEQENQLSFIFEFCQMYILESVLLGRTYKTYLM